MKKKMLFWGLAMALLSAGVSINKSNSVEAQASAKIIRSVSYRPVAYHAKSQQSAYVWNRSHTDEVHNLRNFPHTTWYAQKTVVMRFGRQNLVYFKVISGNGKASGYVWNGYLSKGSYNSRAISGSSQATNSGTTGKVIATDYRGHSVTTNDVDDALNQDLLNLFPGTVPDPKAQLLADEYYLAIKYGGSDAFLDYFSDLYPNEVGKAHFVENNNVMTRSNTAFLTYERKNLASELKQTSKTFDSYQGYHIGAYAFPKASKYYGRVMVVLVPATK